MSFLTTSHVISFCAVPSPRLNPTQNYFRTSTAVALALPGCEISLVPGISASDQGHLTLTQASGFLSEVTRI